MMQNNKNSSLVGSGLFALFLSISFGLVIPFQYGVAQSSGFANVGHIAHLRAMQQDAAYRQKTIQFEQQLYRYMRDNSNRDIGGNSSVIVIPVVIQVAYLPGDVTPAPGTSNPTDAQILQGLEWLNDAFRNRGPYAGGPEYSNAALENPELLDSTYIDMKIEFRLAQVDENGEQTNGINRFETSLSNLVFDEDCPNNPSLDQDRCLRSGEFWDTNRYMNIWLVNDICSGTNGCDIRGYTLNGSAQGDISDGPVLESKYWGTTPDSQTVSIAEVGKYLNLLETTFIDPNEGDICKNGNCLLDGDKICDTPPVDPMAIINCGDTLSSCSTDTDAQGGVYYTQKDVHDVYENFMDPRIFGCKNSFTREQRFVMRTTMREQRDTLCKSASEVLLFKFTNAALEDITNPDQLAVGGSQTPRLFVVNTGTEPITSMRFHVKLFSTPEQEGWHNWFAQNVDDAILPGAPPREISLDDITFNLVQTRRYEIRARIVKVNGDDGDYNLEDNELTERFYFRPRNQFEVVSSFQYCETTETGSMPSGWRALNFDGQLAFDLAQTQQCSNGQEWAFRYNSFDQPGLPEGTRDFLVSPIFDLREINQASLSFAYAYHKAQTDAEDLTFRVLVLDVNTGKVSRIQPPETRCALHTAAQSPCGDYGDSWTPASCDDWKKDVSLNLDDYAGKEIVVIFSLQTNTAFSQNFYLDNICVEATQGCPIPDMIPMAEGRYEANKKSCVDDEGWVHYYMVEEELLLLSIKPAPGDEAPTATEVEVRVMPGYGNDGYDLSGAPYVANNLGWNVMGRYFWIKGQSQLSDSALVRFYYTQTDFKDVQSRLSGGMEEDDLIFFTLANGLNPDPSSGHVEFQKDQFREYRYAEEPSLKTWTWDSSPSESFKSVSFAVSEYGGGSGGSGGDGQGSGALYPPPIENFRGNQSAESMNLLWTTTLEWGTTFFDVFRSSDGINFEKIEPEDALGTSLDSFDYKEYFDRSPIEGVSYYYLQLNHANGMTVLSDTIEVTFDPARIVNVYPNPASRSINIGIEVESAQKVTFEIYDGKWRRLVWTDWLQMRSEITEIDIERLVPGIYFYVVRYNGMDVRGKLVKMP